MSPPLPSPTAEPVGDLGDAAMDRLLKALRQLADARTGWPAESLRRCHEAQVARWFLPESDGGLGWTAGDQLQANTLLASVDLTTAFVLTQFSGACRRLANGGNPEPRERWLKPLLTGTRFGTVGISHLTTSRRHLDQPVLGARPDREGYLLDGIAPWVTGGAHADVIVTGATLGDGSEIVVAVPTDLPGISAGRGTPLIALSDSCTDQVRFDSVRLTPQDVLAGPSRSVLGNGTSGGAGGLQTSSLALGLAISAIEYLEDQAARRPSLRPPADQLRAESENLRRDLIDATQQDSPLSVGSLRTEANGLVMRATSAAMTAAKGAGFVEDHPVGRWCREALFFLVWSCPQPVAQAHLCEMAGLSHP
ncbi:MAG: acyl-CoA dehydrogenase family protein [Planctomycetota bacterium]